jgi:hypothetical protein
MATARRSNQAEAAWTAARDAAAARGRLRDGLCVGAAHPGRPDEYRVRVSASCVAARGEAKRLADARSRAARLARTAPTKAQTRAEVARLEREMREQYPDPAARYDVMLRSGHAMTASFRVLKAMLDPQGRLRFPDPVARYNYLVRAIHKAEPGIAVADYQRHMVLRATLEALTF